MLNDELEYFITNQDQLVNQFPGKILVIKDKQVIGVFNTPLEAYLITRLEHEIGTFMIQPCQKGPEAYTVTINT